MGNENAKLFTLFRAEREIRELWYCKLADKVYPGDADTCSFCLGHKFYFREYHSKQAGEEVTIKAPALPVDFKYYDSWAEFIDILNGNVSYYNLQIKKRGKHPNLYRIYAREEVSKPFWYNYKTFMEVNYPPLLNFAMAYKQYTEQYQYKDKPSQNRFSDLYSSKQRKRMVVISRTLKQLGYKLGIHITLTADADAFVDIFSVYKLMSRKMNILLTTLRRRYNERFVYLRTYETQKSGMPHIHLLVLGKSFIDKEEVTRIWSEVSASGYGVQMDQVREGAGVKDGFEYVSKYVGKQFYKREGEEDVLDMDLVIGWACNWKTLSMSRFIYRAVAASFSYRASTNYSNTTLTHFAFGKRYIEYTALYFDNKVRGYG